MFYQFSNKKILNLNIIFNLKIYFVKLFFIFLFFNLFKN